MVALVIARPLCFAEKSGFEPHPPKGFFTGFSGFPFHPVLRVPIKGGHNHPGVKNCPITVLQCYQKRSMDN